MEKQGKIYIDKIDIISVGYTVYQNVLYIHKNILQNNQKIFASSVYKDTEDGTSNTSLIIGERYSHERGRYLILTRTNSRIHSCRISDSNTLKYFTIENTTETSVTL